MKEKKTLYEDAERALRMLSCLPLPEDMEARVLARVRRHHDLQLQGPGSRRTGLYVRRLLIPALALGSMAVLVFSFHHSPSAPLIEHETKGLSSPATPAFGVATAHRQVLAANRHTPRSPHLIQAPVRAAQSMTQSLNAPPLPLTQQEYLLLALAHTPRLIPRRELDSIISTETVASQVTEENAIFELSHQQLTPMKSIPPGDTE